VLALASIQSFALTTAGGGRGLDLGFLRGAAPGAAVICFISPEGTFAALADILGFVQFFIEKAYVLLVFAGIWALMEGINPIVRAFAIRGLHEEVSGGHGNRGVAYLAAARSAAGPAWVARRGDSDSAPASQHPRAGRLGRLTRTISARARPRRDRRPTCSRA
jgi:hypothetical protein